MKVYTKPEAEEILFTAVEDVTVGDETLSFVWNSVV